MRRNPTFGYGNQLRAEQTILRDHYGREGADAADDLDDIDAIGKLVDEASLICLFHLGQHWRKIQLHPTSHPLAHKLKDSSIPWWKLAFKLDCKRYREPDWHEVGEHPRATPDELVNRFIFECSIRLADHYHQKQIEYPRGQKLRSEEHDALLANLPDASPSFATITPSPRFVQDLKIAKVYREIEPIRVSFTETSLVQVGEKAFEQELGGTKTTKRIKGEDDRSHTVSKVQDFIRRIAKLPTFGEWNKAQPPSRVIAMARSIHASEARGIAFTANLTGMSFDMAKLTKRNTGSSLQDRLRRHLKAEFGVCPDFYFILERGLGQLPHLHGAVELEPSPINRRKLRTALSKLSRADKRRAPERWVDAEPLKTPARWAGYALKHPLTSQSKTGVSSIVFATQQLRTKARKEWEKMRQEQRDAREVMKRVDAAKK
jgi:hypothetical protein